MSPRSSQKTLWNSTWRQCRISVRLADSAAAQVSSGVVQVSVLDNMATAETKFTVVGRTGTPDYCMPNMTKSALPASNSQAKESESVSKPCHAKKFKPKILS